MAEKTIDLPADLTAECALLGSALIDAGACRWMLERLTPGAFYSERNRTIYREIEKLVQDHGQVDISMLVDSLQANKRYIDAGGPSYMHGIVHSVVTSDHVEHYGRVVLRAHFDRLIIRQAQHLADDAKREQALEKIATICRARNLLDAHGGVTMADSVASVLEKLSAGPTVMIETGFGPIDKKTNGSAPGDLVVVGGRTGNGKTAFLISIALNLARAGKRVVFFPGEMAPDDVNKRALANVTGVEHWRIRTGILTDYHRDKLRAGARSLSSLPIFYSSTPSPSLKEIRAFADAYNADVVIVDYLTRCQMPEAETMRVSVNKFMVGIKNSARETERVVYLGAQMNRQMDKAGDSKPSLSDLKESGAIEEESDMVLLLHIDKAETLLEGPISQTVLVAKNRHGETGSCVLSFDRKILAVYGDERNEREKSEARVDLGYS